MKQINVKKMGIACGLTGLLLYLGCIILMFTVGQQGTINFFNNLLHGLDTTTIIKMNVSAVDAAMGLVQTFILFWLLGACISIFYNALTSTSKIKSS